jgi:hypothetical protein
MPSSDAGYEPGADDGQVYPTLVANSERTADKNVSRVFISEHYGFVVDTEAPRRTLAPHKNRNGCFPNP